MIGGTSIGALVGGMYAMYHDESEEEVPLKEPFERFCETMGSLIPKILDITYPFVAMFRGKAFNTVVKTVFHSTRIENLWIRKCQYAGYLPRPPSHQARTRP